MIPESILNSFPEEKRKALSEAFDNGLNAMMIGSHPVLYFGNLPDERNVLIASFSNSGECVYSELYVSALEASLMGYGIITEADHGGMSSVLRGAEDGNGKLFLVSALGIATYREKYREKMIRIMLTGGAVLSTTLDGYDRRGARELSAYLASEALIAVGGDKGRDDSIVQMFLDSGKDAAIVRSSLTSPAGRSLFLSGCPVVSSFSAALESPSVIVYESEGGRFSFMGKEYDACTIH